MIDPIPSVEGVEFDQEGFIVNPLDWNEEVARRLAWDFGIEQLTDDHWKIIHYIREHYLQYGSLPVMSHVCRVNHLNKLAWLELFERGPREAWKIAGLPDPGMEAKAYMDNES